MKKNKKALIFGITGQDGSYLAEFLLKKNYIIHGVKRRSSSANTERIDHIFDSVNFKNKNFYSMIGKKYLNKKIFPFGNKINFNSIRKGNVIGEHEVKFSSGKEIVTLNHESFDRALYSEGALTASKWLIKKKPGLYSMRDLLNFK